MIFEPTDDGTTYVVELRDSSGENVVDLLAEVGDLQVARDTYQAALKRWPGGVITLRQGARVIEDSRQTLLRPRRAFRHSTWLTDQPRARAVRVRQLPSNNWPA